MTSKKGNGGTGWFGFFAFFLLLTTEAIINKLTWGVFIETHPAYEGLMTAIGPWQYLRNPSLVLTLSFYGFDLAFLIAAFIFGGMTSGSRVRRIE